MESWLFFFVFGFACVGLLLLRLRLAWAVYHFPSCGYRLRFLEGPVCVLVCYWLFVECDSALYSASVPLSSI